MQGAIIFIALVAAVMAGPAKTRRLLQERQETCADIAQACSVRRPWEIFLEIWPLIEVYG